MVMGLLVGLGLYIEPYLTDLFVSQPVRALWMLMVVQPALFMGMAVVHWRQRALWAGGAVMALVVLVMGGWVVWRSQIDHVGDSALLTRLGFATSLWWFVALPWFQGWLEQGNWRIPYARLFVLAWNNALVMALTAVCVGLMCAVLGLCASLFALLGLKELGRFLVDGWFMYVYAGIGTGIGLYLARTQERPIQMARQTLHALGCLLLPLMALVIVVFVVQMAFTGLDTLWDTGFAAGLLMGVLVVQIWLVNAVYQDGSGLPTFYGRGVLYLVHASMVCMLLLAGLACFAIGLRVQQYGWTGERVWGAVAAAILLIYSVGYAWAAVRSWPRKEGKDAGAGMSAETGGRAWLAPVSPLNRRMSWVVLAGLLALMTPLLDADRISANDQLERLRTGKLEITHDRLISLRFDHGSYGAAALRGLEGASVVQDETTKRWIAQIGESKARYDVPAEQDDAEYVSVEIARERVPVARNSKAPDADWWDFLLAQAGSGEGWASLCLFKDATCTVLSGDWDADGQTDHMLCRLVESDYDEQSCWLMAREIVAGAKAAGPWKYEGEVEFGFQSTPELTRQVAQQLRESALTTQKRRWPQWRATIRDAENDKTLEVLGRTRH